MSFAVLPAAAQRQSRWLTLCYFSYFSVLAVVMPYLSVYLDAVGFNSRQIGELIALTTSCRIIGPPLWATMADRSGKSLPYVRLGAAVGFLGFAALLWSSDFWWVALTMGLLSLFWSAILPQLEVLSLATLGKHTDLYSRIRVGGSVGFIVVVLLIGELLERAGIESFPLFGMLLVGILMLALWTLYEPGTMSQEGDEQFIGSIWRRFRQRPFLAFLGSTLLLQASFAPFYAFFALYLRHLGYPPLAVGALLALGVVTEILMFLVASKVVVRFGVRYMLLLCMILTALRWTLVSQFAHVITWLIIAQCIHAFSFALHHAASIRFIHQHFPAAEQSRGQAIYIAVGFGGGGAIGALVAGNMWQQNAGAEQTFLLSAGAAVLAGLLTLLMRGDRPKASGEWSAKTT